MSFVDEFDESASLIGARGIGELGATGVDAAVAAAVYDAVGVRVRDLPILPWKVLQNDHGDIPEYTDLRRIHKIDGGAAAALRLDTPSFCSTAEPWRSTVRTDRTRRAAISEFCVQQRFDATSAEVGRPDRRGCW